MVRPQITPARRTSSQHLAPQGREYAKSLVRYARGLHANIAHILANVRRLTNHHSPDQGAFHRTNWEVVAALTRGARIRQQRLAKIVKQPQLFLHMPEPAPDTQIALERPSMDQSILALAARIEAIATPREKPQ